MRVLLRANRKTHDLKKTRAAIPIWGGRPFFVYSTLHFLPPCYDQGIVYLLEEGFADEVYRTIPYP